MKSHSVAMGWQYAIAYAHLLTRVAYHLDTVAGENALPMMAVSSQ